MPETPESIQEVQAIADKLAAHLETCAASGIFDGHDQQAARQYALCVILRARPQGAGPAQGIRDLIPLLDNDFRAMMRRFAAQGEGTQA